MLGVWSFFGVILLLLLLFPFPADSLLSGSLPDCSAKVTESTAFSTSWILASFLAVAVGFFPGSFVVVFWAISCPGPSLEGPPPSSWVFLLFTVSSFDSFYSSVLWDLNIHEIHTAASRSPVVHRDFKFDRGESLN